MVAIPLALSPEQQTPVSPHVTLVHSALPVLEPRVSGCDQDFVHWLFKGMLMSLAVSYLSLAVRIPTNFHSQMLCGCLFLTPVL